MNLNGWAVSGVLILMIAAPVRAAGLPDWARDASGTVSPVADVDTHRHWLYSERLVRVPSSGRRVERNRQVVRILDATGAREIQLDIPYDARSSQVRRLEAWVVSADGRDKRSFGAREWLDSQWLEWGTLRSDLRVRQLVLGGLSAGSIVAWESEVESEPLLANMAHDFGAEDPIALQRLRLELPAGVEPRVRYRGANVGEAIPMDGAWVWERRDLPARSTEPLSPASGSLAEFIAFDLVPSRAGAAVGGASFADWRSASRWLDSLAAPPSNRPATLRERARQIAGPLRDPLAIARAIAREVQSINYVATSVGLARGEGYRPHPAADVLAAGYGDCKDKANLFCELAREAGLEAWLVSASTEGRDRIVPEWPTPGQFNHCIAAVALNGPQLPATLATSCGELTIFDGTDPYTPFGSLPEGLQGSRALLISPSSGELVRLPDARDGASLQSWTLEGHLTRDGAWQGRWHIETRGAQATLLRGYVAAHGRSGLRVLLEQWLADWTGGNRVTLAEVHDEPDSARLVIEAGLQADRFVRTLPDGRVPFAGVPWALKTDWPVATTPRVTPIALEGHEFEATLDLALSTEWQVHEAPAHAADSSAFGRWSVNWERTEGHLRQTIRMRVLPVTLPPAEEPLVRGFLNRARRAGQARALLMRP